MAILGICMVKDEVDIIETTLRHFLAEKLDHIYVADNLSTDGTSLVLESLAKEFANLHVFNDNELAYYQADKMNIWINEFAEPGDWIIPFDADEIWMTKFSATLKEFFDCLDYAQVVGCPVFDMIPDCRTNSTEPARDILYRNPNPELFPVVAFKFNKIARLHQGAHGVDYPQAVSITGGIEVDHFQYRSFDQYKKKLRNGKAVYDATNLEYGIGYHWREGGAQTDEELWIRWQNYCGQEKILKPCHPKGTKYGI